MTRPASRPAAWRRNLMAAVAALLALGPSSALACGPCTDCSTWQTYVNNEITNHQNWVTNTWWNNNVKKALEDMTGQITSAIALEAVMIGGFIDAQNHLYAMRTIEEMNAKALHKYVPSRSVCQFGSLSKSLAASQGKARNNQLVLSERSLARQLGRVNTTGSKAAQDDRLSRLKQFSTRFCDIQDNNTGLGQLCGTGGGSARHNLDIDFVRTIDTKPTLNVDFTDAAVTDDERDILALANNLYAHDLFRRFSADELKGQKATDMRTSFLEMRSIAAKRNVAENSFNRLVAMKSKGTSQSLTFMRDSLTNLGYSADDVKRYMDSATSLNPSYSAQMEILTKKIFQNPQFYVGLMDKPANVQRQYAAMQSLGLMQQRDLFETILRSEMLLSVIVEMEIAKYQDDIQNRLNSALK